MQHYKFLIANNGQLRDQDIEFKLADSFSREIQGNKTVNGTAWHFPIADALDDWFCIRIPAETKRKRGRPKKQDIPTKTTQNNKSTTSKSKSINSGGRNSKSRAGAEQSRVTS
jgi:hypothetical protein